MSEDSVTLFELLNLSIGTPQQGAVNFSALHALLHAVLRTLGIREMKIRWSDPLPGDSHTDALVSITAPGQDRRTEGEQILEEPDLKQEDRSGTELQERITSVSAPAPPSATAADGESKLRSRIQTCEDGVSKAMRLIYELHTQRDNLKEEIKGLCLQQKMVGAEAETVTAVETCCHRVDALEETVRSLRDTFQKYPDPVEPSLWVTWDVMQSALLSEGGNLKELVNSGVADLLRPTHSPVNGNFTAVNTSDIPTSSSPHPVQDSVRTAAPTPGTQPASETSLVLSGPPQQAQPKTGPVAAGLSPSHMASGSERYSETVETLRSISKLREKFNKLEARVASLEEGTVDQTQLAQLRELITEQGSQDVTVHLMDQLKEQRALIDSLMSDREKLDSLEDMFMILTSQDRETSSEAASGTEDSDSKDIHELRQQISLLRRSVQKLEEGLKQLKARQALTEERLRDQHLQDQLDDLRGKLEDMMLSLTSKLSSSLQDEAGQDESGSQGLGQGKEGSAFTTSAVNTGKKLSRLFQLYEHLQDTVNSLLQQQTGGRAGTLQDRESVELVNDVQKAILQLQAECEKLHETTQCLHEDNRLKQNHIEELYKTTEELGEKKADKQMVESEIKADKSALDSKVSRMQFDSATEQLNTMFHELQNKVTDQAQDWHKVIDKLSDEMECKLVRIELDSVKKQLEDCRKNIHEKLQAQGGAEHEDAAGIRKQLVDRFHCLSCDRPVVKQTPGPHLMTLPSTPGFPSHKSIRPFTVYALEQFRQHYRSERIAELTDYGHLAVSRSCGGSHTVTSASQRRLQYMKYHSQPEGDGVVQSEEVDIVGLDGHIYRGRLNAPTIRTTETKLPTISTKDVTTGVCKTKDKAKCSPSHKPAASPEVGHSTPVHPPHSAKSGQCSRSASSSSGRDWPVSALGCTSQSSITQASAAAESATEPQDQQQADL
ncbi:glutamine-rich protein 2-like isoform X2 [Trachinotus anak]|uniref:glutamine-rich protein 2-like isoform X2 n=1 Tax=Trachinotus anak TaxID=443729 RepID=UPI0039F24E78